MSKKKVHVDKKGYVYVEGVKVCRVDKGKSRLFFHDKHSTRSRQRGSSEVGVSINELNQVVEGESRV